LRVCIKIGRHKLKRTGNNKITPKEVINLNTISQGQQSPVKTRSIRKHEINSWLMLKEQMDMMDLDGDYVPNLRMKDNLFTI